MTAQHLASRMDGEVLATVRYARWPTALGLLLCGGLEAGLLYALGRAVVTGSWSIDDESPSVAEDVVGWSLCLVFVVLLGIAVPVIARTLVSGRLVDLITADEAVETQGGRQTIRVDLATATRITYLPSLRATWQRSGKAADRRVRWTPQGVGYDRLVLEGDGQRLELTSSSRHWPDVVNAVETWTARRPDLAADEETRAFLATPYPRPHSRLVRWSGPLVCMAAVFLLITGFALHWGDGSLGALWFSALASSVFFGSLLWVGLVRPVLETLRGLGAVVTRRDPWAFFDPDEHGRYNWLLDGRLTLLRSPKRKTLLGLAWRVMAVLLVVVVPVVVVGSITSPLWAH